MANKSITAHNIPKALLDKKTAKDHFGQFGKITSFVLYPKRSCCIVEYENANSAQSAVQYGTIYDEDEFDVSFTKELNETKVMNEYDGMLDHPFKPVPVNIPSLLDLPMFREKREYHSPPRTALAGMKSLSSKLSGPVKFIGKPENDEIINQLRQLLRKPAYTPEDKYRVLDARDKLLRLTSEKTTDLKKAKVSVGVCPDMCPEKERVMREFQRQVAIFEQDTNSRDQMDHTKGLKQYSRSSADQEAPLAHELRPQAVLQRTMIYLLRNIIDLCESPNTNLSDWYNFLWDRTRSIRKDITQQELCSLNSVELVEQCARFHIHCAGRLVAEDLTVFDPKINTENLTKCLQTLKYMYHDLALKGINCPNEAEFRGYIVLLNLNDSNFLWEIKQLRKEIQESPEIRFAINVYLAMDCNNYVKFFNLVRGTNYLNGCIVLRYFNQVRTKALNILLKCYTHQKNSVNFSISYLTDILGFENNENAIIFLEYNGFPILENDCVVFNRKYYGVPDFPFTMDRCLELIESKRDASVGQVICGKVIPELEYIKPHDSFDANGILKLNAMRAEDQNYFKRNEIMVDVVADDLDGRMPLNKETTYLAPKTPSPKMLSPKLPSPKVTQPPFSFSLPTSLISAQKTGVETSSTFSFLKSSVTPSSIFGNSTNIFKAFDDNIEKHRKISLPSMDDNVDIVCAEASVLDDDSEQDSDQEEEAEDSDDDDGSEIEETEEEDSENSANVESETETSDADDEEALQLAELKKIKEDMIEQKAKSLLSEILNEFIEDELSTTTESLKLDTKSNEIFNSILNDIIYLMIKEESFINYYKTARYYIKWRHVVKNKIHKKSLLEQFPIWIPNQEIKKEQPPPNIRLAQKREKHVNLNNLLEQNNKLFNLSQYNSTNILTEIEQNFLKRNRFIAKNNFYWKLLVSVPSERESYNFYYFIKIILENLFKNFNTNPNYLYFNSAESNSKKLNVCIRKAVGDNLIGETGHPDPDICRHMNSLVFFINCDGNLESGNFNLINKRLENIVKNSNIPAKIPIAIIICCSTNQTTVRLSKEWVYGKLNLAKYQNLFDINVTLVKYFNNNFNVIIDSFKSAVNTVLNKFNLNFIYSIEMLPLTNFMEQYLGDSLWFKCDDIIKNNALLLKLSNNINYVINFYNCILIKNYDNLLNDSYANYFSLPSEFAQLMAKQLHDDDVANLPRSYEYFPQNWNTNFQWREKCRDMLTKLKLAEFQYGCTDAESFDAAIQKYIKSEIKIEKNRNFVYLNILKYVKLINEYFYYRTDNLNLLSFIEIVKIITKTKLLEIIRADCSNSSEAIVYNKEKLNCILNSNLMINKDLIKYVREIENQDGPVAKKRKVD